MVEKRRCEQNANNDDDGETFDPVKHFEENESQLIPSANAAALQAAALPKPVYASIDKSDSSDSDTEYMREAKERNLKSLKYKALHPNNARKKNADSTDSDDDNDSRTGDDSRSSGKRAADSDDATIINVSGPVSGFGGAGGLGGGGGSSQSSSMNNSGKQRVKRSRWGEKVISPVPPQHQQTHQPQASGSHHHAAGGGTTPRLTSITRSDPNLLKYAMENFGSINLTEEEWFKAEEAYKVNLLYQDMVRKRQEIDQFAKSGRFKYEYDSDEDVKGKNFHAFLSLSRNKQNPSAFPSFHPFNFNHLIIKFLGGTWEHKLRVQEMEATQLWADALNKQAEGKHHIGDFLPPEELRKFLEKYEAQKGHKPADLSDYKEFKLKEDNVGFQMLQKLGWKEGQGLGAEGSGILEPVNK